MRAERTEPLNVQIVANLENLIRSLIVTPYGLVFISEQKYKIDDKLLDLTVYLSPDKQSVQELIRISNPDGVKTGFSYSRSSIASKGNIFFTFFEGKVIFKDQHGILRWQIYK